MTQTTEQERAEFHEWKLRDNPKYKQTDDSMQDRRDWLVWQAARRAQVVPDGWKLLPESPTQEMCDAAKYTVHAGLSVFKWADGYYAMLDAAPQPPEAATDDSSGVGSLIESREVVSKPKSGLTVTRLNLSEAGRAALQSKATHISVVSGAVAAPAQMPEADGLFSFGANDDKPTYHHGQTDKQWLNELLDKTVTGGPYRSECAYSESKVRQLLAAHGIK